MQCCAWVLMACLLQMLRDSRSIKDLKRHVSMMKVFSEDRQLFLLFYQTRETSPKGVYVREFWSHLPSCLIPHTVSSVTSLSNASAASLSGAQVFGICLICSVMLFGDSHLLFLCSKDFQSWNVPFCIPYFTHRQRHSSWRAVSSSWDIWSALPHESLRLAIMNKKILSHIELLLISFSLYWFWLIKS